MKNKIIKLKDVKSCKEVLVARCRMADSGYEAVEISAWHTHPDDGEFYQSEVVEFYQHSNDSMMADRYIQDFSEASAKAFALSFNF